MVTVSCWHCAKIYYVLCIAHIVTKRLLWHDDRKYWIGIHIRPGNYLDGRPEFWLCNWWITVFQSDNLIENLFEMTQLVENVTRQTLTTSTSIDVIFTTISEKHLLTDILETTFSGHYCVYTVLDISKPTPLKHRHNFVKFRDFKHFDENALLNDVRNNACFQNHYGSGCSQRLGYLEMQRSIPCYF